MPIATYEMPQAGSFVADPHYGGHSNKWGASYVAAPPHASYHPSAEGSMYGSAPGFSFGHNYASAPAPCAPPYPQYPMTSPAQSYQMSKTASFTQMPTTASFTYEQPAQPYSYQQQYAAAHSSYAIPQQQSFVANPQHMNYPSMRDGFQFQFYPSGPSEFDRPSRSTTPMNRRPTEPEHAKLVGPTNDLMPGEPSRSKSPMPNVVDVDAVKPTGPVNHANTRPARSKSPMPKPNSSTSRKPPGKKLVKKNQGCCSCGV